MAAAIRDSVGWVGFSEITSPTWSPAGRDICRWGRPYTVPSLTRLLFWIAQYLPSPPVRGKQHYQLLQNIRSKSKTSDNNDFTASTVPLSLDRQCRENRTGGWDPSILGWIRKTSCSAMPLPKAYTREEYIYLFTDTVPEFHAKAPQATVSEGLT